MRPALGRRERHGNGSLSGNKASRRLNLANEKQWHFLAVI
jgi:hypothetical protein